MSIKQIHVVHSGGAIGSDTKWAEEAIKHGHIVIDYSFADHKIKSPHRYILTSEQLRNADSELTKASHILKRNVSQNKYIKNLLRRNYYQIVSSDKIYAVVETFKQYKISDLGGTAWAITMFINQKKTPVYIFGQNEKQWYLFNSKWLKINKPPKPSGNYTAIGTRKLNSDGRKAIEAIYI